MSNKIFVVIIMIFYTQLVQAKKETIDIYTSVGYKNLTSDNKDPNLTGGSLGINFLYSIPNYKKIIPIIGASLERTTVKGVQSYTIENKQLGCSFNSTTQTVYHSYDYVTLNINGGIKIRPTENWNFMGIGNVGYSFYNNYNEEIYGGQNNYINISDHFLFGTTLLATYRLGNVFSLGTNVVFNLHHLNKKSLQYSENVNYIEKSVNLVFMWSL